MRTGLFAGLAVWCTACGSESGGPAQAQPDSGRPPGSAPAAPPEAAAFISVAAAGGSCSATHGALAFPQESRVLDRLTCNLANDCDPAEFVVADGEGGSSVSCRVEPTGGTFNVAASVSREGSQLQVTGNVPATGGTVRVTHFYRESGVSLSGDCTLSIADGQGTLSAGRIWGRFQCPSFTDPSAAGGMECTAEGAILFQKCDGG